MGKKALGPGSPSLVIINTNDFPWTHGDKNIETDSVSLAVYQEAQIHHAATCH